MKRTQKQRSKHLSKVPACTPSSHVYLKEVADCAGGRNTTIHIIPSHFFFEGVKLGEKYTFLGDCKSDVDDITKLLANYFELGKINKQWAIYADNFCAADVLLMRRALCHIEHFIDRCKKGKRGSGWQSGKLVI